MIPLIEDDAVLPFSNASNNSKSSFISYINQHDIGFAGRSFINFEFSKVLNQGNQLLETIITRIKVALTFENKVAKVAQKSPPFFIGQITDSVFYQLYQVCIHILDRRNLCIDRYNLRLR